MNLLDISTSKQIVLLFFFLFFCGVLVWVFFSQRARQFPQESRLPLEEGKRVPSEKPNSVKEAHHV